MADSHYDAPTRIQELLEYLHEREVDLETLADSKRNRLEQCVQLRNFEVEARQVVLYCNNQANSDLGKHCCNSPKHEQLCGTDRRYLMIIQV